MDYIIDKFTERRIVGAFARRIYVTVLCDRGATAFHDGQVSERYAFIILPPHRSSARATKRLYYIANLPSAPSRVGSIHKCEAAQKRRFILIPPYLSAECPRLPKQEGLSFILYLIIVIERSLTELYGRTLCKLRTSRTSYREIR